MAGLLEKLKEYSKYLLPFLIVVFIYSFITDFNSTMLLCSNVLGFIGFILSRFIIGFVLAYLLNFLSSWLQKIGLKRWLSITITYLLFFGAIAWLILYIIPLIYDSIQKIVTTLPQYYETIKSFVNRFFYTLSDSDRQQVNDYISQTSEKLLQATSGYFEFSNVKTFVLNSTRVIINIIFGVIISIYGLIEKDRLIRSSKRVLYAFAKKERADGIVTFMRESEIIFSKFIVGKLLSSLIVGIVSFILYAIFGLPLAAFFAVVAGIFNLIPYFGPWIGGAVTIIILLCFDPIYAIYALFIMLAVQTIDNFFISPKVLGGLVGISPLLTIVAITLGGNIGGFVGMFFGIPVLAVIKLLIIDRIIYKRLKKRDIKIE